jgi:hypothetical protein
MAGHSGHSGTTRVLRDEVLDDSLSFGVDVRRRLLQIEATDTTLDVIGKIPREPCSQQCFSWDKCHGTALRVE